MSVPERSEEHIDDVDAFTMPQQDVLIQPWSSSDSRLAPRPADAPLTSAAYLSPANSAQAAPAIRPSQSTFTNSNSSQDVRHPLSVDSGPHLHPSSPATWNGHSRPFESLATPSQQHTFQHGSINTLNFRPRTILPVFGTTSTLAAHYGIPTKLPPIPRVNSNNTNNNRRPPVPHFHESAASTSTATPINQNYIAPATTNYPDLQSLIASYLNMINDKSEEENNNNNAPASAAQSSPVKAPAQLQPAANQAAQDSAMLFGGPTDFTGPSWGEYLTSPFMDMDDETPFESFLDTPAQPTMPDSFQSPLVADVGTNALMDPIFDDMPLMAQPAGHDFAKMSLETAPTPASHTSAVAPGSASPEKPAVLSFEGMYTMSPATPALEPSSVQPSPLIRDASTAAAVDSPRRNNKKAPTGTRKNVSPDSLVPIEAPTQPRNYLMPSQTSRKAVPAVFARKRARSAAFGADEEDELAGSDCGGSVSGTGALDAPVNEQEAEAIAAKRRQNTLAARRSRKRKLEYQRELEEGLEMTRREREMWKERAMMLRAQVMQLGFPDPFRET